MTSHDEIRSLLGVYALDAIDDQDELAAVESHLVDCAECRAEVDAHRSVTTVMAEAELRAPSGLWDRIESQIAAPPRHPSAWRPWTHLQGLTSIAAVVALFAAVGMTVLWANAAAEAEDLRAEIDQTRLALADAPLELAVDLVRERAGVFEVTVGGAIGSSQAVVLPDGRSWLTDVEFAPLDSSRTYQLWAIQDGTVISAGILGSAPGTVAFHVDSDRLDGIVITIEDAGGVISSSNEASAAWLAGA